MARTLANLLSKVIKIRILVEICNQFGKLLGFKDLDLGFELMNSQYQGKIMF